jgi:hypothetical protein
MEISKETILILISLMPGFISVLIYNKLIYRGEIEVYNKVIEALIYSLLIYFGTIILTGKFPVSVLISQTDKVEDYASEYNKISIVTIVLLSVIYPIFLGYLNKFDLLHRFFRIIRVTNRTGRDSIWLDVFYDLKRTVIVHMKDGRRLLGWPQYFSNKVGPAFLYLIKPSWIDKEGKYIDLDIDGVFLIDHENVSHIEFMTEKIKGGQQ